MTAALVGEIATLAIGAGLTAVLTAYLWWVHCHRNEFPDRPGRTDR